MTQMPAPFVVSPEERARIADVGMYRPELEGDACGVGLVAATDGKPQRRVVTAAIGQATGQLIGAKIDAAMQANAKRLGAALAPLSSNAQQAKKP